MCQTPKRLSSRGYTEATWILAFDHEPPGREHNQLKRNRDEPIPDIPVCTQSPFSSGKLQDLLKVASSSGDEAKRRWAVVAFNCQNLKEEGGKLQATNRVATLVRQSSDHMQRRGILHDRWNIAASFAFATADTGGDFPHARADSKSLELCPHRCTLTDKSGTGVWTYNRHPLELFTGMNPQRNGARQWWSTVDTMHGRCTRGRYADVVLLTTNVHSCTERQTQRHRRLAERTLRCGTLSENSSTADKMRGSN